MATRVQIVTIGGPDGIAFVRQAAPARSERDEGELVERRTARDGLTDVVTVLRACAAGDLRVSEKTQRPSAATVRALTSMLRHGDFYDDGDEDPIAAFAWPLLVQAGGLAEVSSGGRLALTAKGRAAVGRPPHEAIRTLWKRWISHGLIDEFSRIDVIKGQKTANTLTAVGPRRKAVAEALATTCRPGEWIDVDDLFRALRAGGPSFKVARNLWKLYIVDRDYGCLGYDGYHEWPVVQGRYVLCLLFEYAATLGLFDIRYDSPVGARDDYAEQWGADDLDYLSRYDGLAEIRLNPLGAYALGLVDDYVPEDEPDDDGPPDVSAEPLRILPNLDVVVTGDMLPDDDLTLNAFAERRSERVWALTLTALLGAVDRGRTVAELRDFLVRRSGAELPVAVATLISDAEQRMTKLQDVGVVRVVACADRALATLISRDRKLRGYVQVIGERHLAIDPEREAEFRGVIRKLGYALPPA